MHSTGWLRFPLSYHREQKFVKHANEHIQKSAQRLADEDALTSSCFFNLEDEIVESERRNARMHLHRWNEGVKKVLVLKGELSCESCAREREDSVLLDTVIESQQLLQHTVRSAVSFLFLSRDGSRLFAVLGRIRPFVILTQSQPRLYPSLPLQLYATFHWCCHPFCVSFVRA